MNAIVANATATPTRHAALLARLLAESMMANVQSTAGLNRSAADALLSLARLATPLRFAQIDDAWRASWRSFELSAHTADRLLRLSREHIERSTLGLARMTELLLGELGQLHASRIETLREAFDAVREAQETYLQATEQAHRRVIALAAPVANTEVIDAH
jgi:predicted RNase H-like HicB family nuclease